CALPDDRSLHRLADDRCRPGTGVRRLPRRVPLRIRPCDGTVALAARRAWLLGGEHACLREWHRVRNDLRYPAGGSGGCEDGQGSMAGTGRWLRVPLPVITQQAVYAAFWSAGVGKYN